MMTKPDENGIVRVIDSIPIPVLLEMCPETYETEFGDSKLREKFKLFIACPEYGWQKPNIAQFLSECFIPPYEKQSVPEIINNGLIPEVFCDSGRITVLTDRVNPDDHDRRQVIRDYDASIRRFQDTLYAVDDIELLKKYGEYIPEDRDDLRQVYDIVNENKDKKDLYGISARLYDEAQSEERRYDRKDAQNRRTHAKTNPQQTLSELSVQAKALKKQVLEIETLGGEIVRDNISDDTRNDQ